MKKFNLTLLVLSCFSLYAMEGNTFHSVVKAGNLEEAQKLFESGGDVDSRYSRDDTLLHVASFYGHECIAKYLLACGAPVDAVNTHGETPLHHAAAKGHDGVVTLLLEHGADVTVLDTRGAQPLHGALDSEVIQSLLARGAEVNAMNNDGHTLLDLAVLKKRQRLVIFLKTRGAMRGMGFRGKRRPGLQFGVARGKK